METDLDIVLQNLNATATDDRKYGISKFLEAIKNFYHFDINGNNSMDLRILFNSQVKVTELFTAIGRLLRDPDWKIRKDSFEILITIITKDVLKDKLDFYMSNIIKHFIKCLSDGMMTVRKSATQCFHEYLNKTNNFESTLQDFIDYGLNADLDFKQRQDNNQALQVILTSNFSGYDFKKLVIGVLEQLRNESDTENKIQLIVIEVLKSIKKLVGEERFIKYIIELPINVLPLYHLCSSSIESQIYNSSPSSWNASESVNENGKLPISSLGSANYFQSKKFTTLGSSHVNETVHFGFIPKSIIDDMNNDHKLEAIEEIYNIFKLDITVNMKLMLPYFAELLQLIQRLMEDKYLVVMTAFKLLIEMVNCVPSNVVKKHFDLLLQLLRAALLHNVNGDAIIQKYIMSFSMILFQKADTNELVTKLCDSQFMTDPKQASIRQASIDIIISALLQFPSTKFNLDFLCAQVSQRLLDKKQKVKQAALECISVINYNYGNGKINTLLKIVEQAPKGDSTNNIPDLVQARLSKHRLPHVDDLGMVVYVTDNDKFSNHRKQSFIDLENSSSDNSPISSANLEKRRPSAGKVRGRAKLPWDLNESSTYTSGYSSGSNTFRNNYDSVARQNSDSSTPTNSTNVVPRNNPQSTDSTMENSPIPTKPALGRSASSRRKDFESNVTNQIVTNDDKLSNGILITNDNQSELINCNLLQGVRNSASKKKALKLFNSSNQTQSSNNVNQELKDTLPKNNVKLQQENAYSQISNEAQPIPSSHNGPTFKLNPQYATMIVGKSVGVPPIETNDIQLFKKKQPMKGIHYSFSLAQEADIMTLDFDKNPDEKSSSRLLIKTASDDLNIKSDLYEIKNSSQINSKRPFGFVTTSAFEDEFKSKPIVPQNPLRQKISSETSLSPSYVKVNYLNNEDNDFNQLSSRPDFNVIGKSMLETSAGNISQRSGSIINENKKHGNNAFLPIQTPHGHFDTPPNSKNVSRNSISGPSIPDFNNGIIGIGLTDKVGVEEDSDEEPNKGIMSNTLRESLSLKRQKVANELHSYKSETNTTPSTPASYSAPGSGASQTAHRKPPAGGYYYMNNLPSSAGNERDITNGYEVAPSSRKPLRPVLGNITPKKIKPRTAIVPNAQSNPPSESISVNPAPLSNPDKSIMECLNLIQNEDWEKKITAMITIQSLVQFHSEVLIARSPDVHAICIALCKECKNLRSQVAKCAIQTVGQLFAYLRKYMDPVLDNVVANLLSKAGEGTNSFLKQDVEATLVSMIENVSPNRAFLALLQCGADHKNRAIRRLAACNVMLLCEKLGSGKTMSCIKEIPEKIFPGIIKFVMDGNQETRYYGKKIISELNQHPDFEKLIMKNVLPKDIRVFKDILDNIKIKGIGDPPQFSHSAGMQRSGSLSRGSSAGNLVALGSKSSFLLSGNSRSMTRLPGSELSDDDKDWLTNTCTQLSSSDFRNRQIGLEAILNKTELDGLDLPQKGISKLLKEFIPRLNDNNTKVTATAIYIFQKIMPYICSIFPTEFLPEFINTIALNFASKSAELRESATNLMKACFSNLDHSLLIQPCIEAINKSNSKTKPILIENMNDLLSAIEESKSPSLTRSTGMIVRHLIPEIGLLLEKNRPLPPQMKEPVHNLVVLAYQIVGQEMIDSTAQRGDQTLKQAIIDILNLKNAHNS